MTEIYKKWDNLRRGVLQIKEADSVTFGTANIQYAGEVATISVTVDGGNVLDASEYLPCKIKGSTELTNFITTSSVRMLLDSSGTPSNLLNYRGDAYPESSVDYLLYSDSSNYYLSRLCDAIYPVQVNWSTNDVTSPSYIKNKPSVEVTGNRVATITSNTTTTKYPTVGAVRDYVASELQSYVPDVSGKEDVSNKVTAWSTSVPEGETDPVITPSDTKYPSEKLVYDFVNNNYQPVGNYLTAQDISGKEDTSNKVTTWSSTPSDSNYPSEKLVYDTIPTVMGASGNSHKGGLVPDTPSTLGTLKYLCENGTWSIPTFELTVIIGTNITQTLNPNIYYSFGTVTQLTISFANIIDGINNEYIFEFDSGSTATTLSIPASVVGIDATAIKANKHYEISIKYDASNQNYYGLIEEW